MSQSDFVTKGQTLVSAGQFQEAVKVCRLGLLGRPTTVEGRVVLGQALLALKRYDEVLAEMRVALELDHSSTAALLLKGEALLRKGDGRAAVDALSKLRAQGRTDAQATSLLAEAEALLARAPADPTDSDRISAGASDFSLEQGTKNYPAADQAGSEPSGGGSEYTRPTVISVPGPRKRKDDGPVRTPSLGTLAVGDHSGTVEVDPDVDVIDSQREDDFGDLAAPPVERAVAPPAPIDELDGTVVEPPFKSLSTAAAVAGKKARRGYKEDTSSVELHDEELLDIDDSRLPEPRSPTTGRTPMGPGTRVRNAVKLPSGPIDLPDDPAETAAMPSHLAQLIANQPHIMNVSPASRVQARPVAPEPGDFDAAMTLQGAAREAQHRAPTQLPTGELEVLSTDRELQLTPESGFPQLASPQTHPTQLPPASAQASVPSTLPGQMAPQPSGAMPMAQSGQLPSYPQGPPPEHPSGFQPGNPSGPHMGYPSGSSPMPGQLAPHLQQTQLAMPPPISSDLQMPAHLQSSMAAAHPGDPGAPWNGPPPGYPVHRNEDQARPPEVDPQIAAMLPPGASVVPTAFAEPARPARAPRTGRRARSRTQLVVWVLIGALVIGGGVFAGFQIRAIRLHRQIAAARDRAVDVARADTWQGWMGARDSLSSIAQAAPSVDNKAALAHARGVLAYELGDGVGDARAAVDALASESSVDLDVARAYVGLAQSDAKTAREAADRAVKAAPSNAAALYAAGRAALAAGDLKAATASLRSAVEREPRPLYVVGLARALAAATAWDEAIAALDRVRDNPTALITRGFVLAAAGRVAGAPGSDLRGQLAKLIAEGQKPGDHDHASPAQVAFAGLALAQVDFARNELGAAHAGFLAIPAANLDDQRFAEEYIETGYAIDERDAARKAAVRAVEKWPTSQRARVTLAQLQLADGKPAVALELFTKAPDAAASPRGQTVRGLARLATGDRDGARADFDGVLAKVPGYEPAIIERSWLDLATGKLDDARKRIEPRIARSSSTALVALHAAILRASGDPAQRAQAKDLLIRVVGGAPSPDTARAQLELARIQRDLGDVGAASKAYAEAARGGSFDARLEQGLFSIELGEPKAGREVLEQLLKDAGASPSAALLLEVARARALLGDHAGAGELLVRAGKAPGVTPWQLARERGRLALRRSDTALAAQQLERALDTCGGDLETFLLAADTVATDERQAALGQKVKTLLPVRIKGRPEHDIVRGKLELAAGRQEAAEAAYQAARSALFKEKALSRRRAQADFGIAAIAYFKKDDPTALSTLALVMVEDPTLYAAYLFNAEIAKVKEPRKALELAEQATALNPDSIDGWKLVGTLAADLGDRKLLATAVTRVGALDPGSETFKLLDALR